MNYKVCFLKELINGNIPNLESWKLLQNSQWAEYFDWQAWVAELSPPLMFNHLSWVELGCKNAKVCFPD